MALITKFIERADANAGWRSTVECGYAIRDSGYGRVLHLETYGSEARRIPGKVSQSLQLDREAAWHLRQLIDRAFPDLGR
jgi:hypothetical protein